MDWTGAVLTLSLESRRLSFYREWIRQPPIQSCSREMVIPRPVRWTCSRQLGPSSGRSSYSVNDPEFLYGYEIFSTVRSKCISLGHTSTDSRPAHSAQLLTKESDLKKRERDNGVVVSLLSVLNNDILTMLQQCGPRYVSRNGWHTRYIPPARQSLPWSRTRTLPAELQRSSEPSKPSNR
jgi:hypothetical protein